MTLDLNELANMPGYGRAQQVIKDKGFWREDYTFDDVVDWLETKNVVVSTMGNAKLVHDMDCGHIENSLRKAMEV